MDKYVVKVNDSRYYEAKKVFESIKYHYIWRKFMCQTNRDNADIVIDGYYVDNTLFLEIIQNGELVFDDTNMFVDEIVFLLDGEKLDEKFAASNIRFKDKLHLSFSRVRNVKDGCKNFLSITSNIDKHIPEEVKETDEYINFKRNMKIYESNIKNQELFIEHLKTTYILMHSNISAMDRVSNWFSFDFSALHSNYYSAIEHAKIFVKYLHILLKPLGFKKKGQRFTLVDNDFNVDKVIWVQRGRFNNATEAYFTINFSLFDNGEYNAGNFFRVGKLLTDYGDYWIDVNIHIIQEEVFGFLDMCIKKINSVLLPSKSFSELEILVNDYKD